MTPLLLTLALFTVWWLIGVAALVVVRADMTSLRIVLTAPVLGTAATLIPLFTLSHVGVAMEDGAPAVTIALVGASAIVLAIRRPKLPGGIIPVLAICIAGLLLVGHPFFTFGFRWLAYANDDMANYVLSATYLLHHGLLTPIDYVGLRHDSDYASVSASLHLVGSRPGADITLAALARVIGRPPEQVFMPLILGLNLCTACGTAALAMQASRRWWAAAVAAALVAVSPQTTYGLLLQLLPQVWALGLAVALCALLMRRELHRDSGAGVRDVIPISMLIVAIIVVYIELASTLALAYVLFIVALALRRDIDLRVAVRMWLPILAIVAIVLNRYGMRELDYLRAQTTVGIHGLFSGPPNWGYTLVPSALPGIIGIQVIPTASTAPLLQWSIVAAAILLIGALAASLLTAFRGVAASVALLAYAVIGLFLALKDSDFGLFKLYMYVQPFLAAAVAVWLAMVRRRRTLMFVALPLIALFALQISTQRAYVGDSANPLALRDASTKDLLPVFRRLVATDKRPVISVTENSVLGKLEAVSMGERPLYFISQNLFTQRSSKPARVNGWQRRSFAIVGSHPEAVDQFWENIHAVRVLSAGRCTIVLPSGNQIVLNRRWLPEGHGDLVTRPCDSPRNILVFTASKLGWGFYGLANRRAVSFYPPQRDFAFRGRTMSAYGRYALFRILKPAPRVRLELDLSTTNLQSLLPPAAVVGKTYVPLPVLGRGAAHVFSAPVQTQTIDGQPYLLLDMGRSGTLPVYRRSGVAGLYGRSVPLDPRYLTAFVRNISLITDAQYERLRPPSTLSSFPAALIDPNLEYSGIYEDGWVGADSYAVLAGGKAANLVVRAEVRPVRGRQRLEVLVDGREVAAREVDPGHLDLQVALPASPARRRVELRWRSASPLPEPDGRRAAAIVRFLGVVPRGSVGGVVRPPLAVREFPKDLTPTLSYSGIYPDGWLERQAFVVLASGRAADLHLKADVPPAPGGQRLEVIVNGRELVARVVAPGQLELRVALPASRVPRRVELRWRSAPRLPAPDGRATPALLRFLGIVAPASH
jgi:hypothetical protein